MLKIKCIAAGLIALTLVFSAGSANYADAMNDMAITHADMLAYSELTEPAATPEPSSDLTLPPDPTLPPEPTQTPGPTLPPKPSRPPKPTLPPKDDGGLLFPEIPSDAPAPPQIKRLDGSGMVCLTFDDGSGEDSIKKILDCLRANGVHCTFFIIGSCLKLYPDLWRQAVADGHEIAYHTMSHKSLNTKSSKGIVKDLNLWNETAHTILGADYKIPKIARAPYGNANARVRRLFYCLGYKLIYWSSDTYTGVYRYDHSNYAARIAAYIIRMTSVGSISLQHFNKYDAASVSLYIGTLKGKFKLGTISEALAASGG